MDLVTDANGPARDHTGVHPSEPERTPFGRADQSECINAEPGRELRAAGVRLPAHLEHRVPDRETGAGREVLGGEIEVDVELVARERPAINLITRDELGE